MTNSERSDRSGDWLRPLLLVAALLTLAARAPAQQSCDSEKCHAKLLAAANVHAVASECESCHESIATPHPRKGTKTFKLAQEQPDLCNTCHDPIAGGSHVHPPVEAGTCTTCHDPHATRQAKLLREPQKELCATCHADRLEHETLHGPVSAGDCTNCHAAHAAGNSKLLVKEEPELCFACHVDFEEELKKKVHVPVQAGCTGCHDPHGSAHASLLSAEGEAVCSSCHGDIQKKVEERPVVHAAVLTGCPTCHAPHASEHDALLVNEQKELCLSCHGEVLEPAMTVLHGPIRDGKCAACHDPHASAQAKLLATDYPDDMYVSYTGNEYALCFTCHKRDLLQYPETSFATNFRDGERNLHFLHVNNRKKGRACRLCHEIHGGANPRLIADTVSFGQWKLPLHFEKTDTGGSCSPGCHKPLSYDRERPGRKPRR